MAPGFAWPAHAVETMTFTQTSPITINDDDVPTAPYPSTIEVSGLSSSTYDVDVTLTGLTHTYSSDIDMVLVAPSGAAATVLSDVGEASSVVDVSLVLDDQAAGPVSSPLMAGRYRPTDIDDPADLGEDLPSHGLTLGQVASSGSVNGRWELYVYDDQPEDLGSLRSWSLTFTAPDRPTITSPAAGSVGRGTTISARGTGSPGSTVYVTLDAQTPRAVTVAPDGTWATDFTGVADGIHSVRASRAASGREPGDSALVNTTLDNAAPTGTLTIRPRTGSAELTSSRRVDLVIQASERIKGVRVSNDGAPWDTLLPLPLTNTLPWTLGATDGRRTVLVQLEDMAGNVSQGSISDTVVLDQVAPRVSRTWPAAGATGVRRDVVVRAKFDDFVTANPSISLRDTARVYRVGTTRPVRAVVGYDADRAIVKVNPARALRADTTYKVVVGGFRDAAGNYVDGNPIKAGSQPKVWRFRTR